MPGVARVVLVLLLICAALAGWGVFTAHTVLQEFAFPGETEHTQGGFEDDSRRPAEFLTGVPIPIIVFCLLSALGVWRGWFWIRIFTPIWTWIYLPLFIVGLALAIALIEDFYGLDGVPTDLMINMGLFFLIPLLLFIVFILMFTRKFRLWAIRKKKRQQLEHQALMQSHGAGFPGGPPAPGVQPTAMSPYGPGQPPMGGPGPYPPSPDQPAPGQQPPPPPPSGPYSPPPGQQPPPGPYSPPPGQYPPGPPQ